MPAPLVRAGQLLLCAALAGCSIVRGQPGVLIASDPPGATIVVDGRNSGYVTPAAIYLTRTDWHRIDVDLEGYERETRIVGPGIRTETVPWTSGYTSPVSWWFPLFLDGEELLVALRVDDNLQPSRLHLKLDLAQAE